MLPLSKISRKENKNPSGSTSKLAQELLQKAKLVQRSFGFHSTNTNTISSSRYNSKLSSRKQSLN